MADAVDIFLIQIGKVLAIPQKVDFFKASGEARLAAFTRDIKLGLGRPGILGFNEKVRAPVRRLSLGNRGLFDEGKRAQVTFGLLDAFQVRPIAGVHEHFPADDGGSGGDMDSVGQAEQPEVLARHGGIKNVPHFDGNLANLEGFGKAAALLFCFGGGPGNKEKADQYKA